MKQNKHLIIGLLIVCLASVLIYLLINMKNSNNKNEQKIDEINYGAITDVYIPNNTIDLGVICESDTVLYAKYIINNVGEKNLIILDLSTDCKCTGYDISKKTILPGDSAIVTLRFNPKGIIGDRVLRAALRVNSKPHSHILKITVKVVPA